MTEYGDEKLLQVTLTGEPAQPVRLYYEVRDKELLVQRLRRLRCMDFDPNGRRWVWLYAHEAQALAFKKPYAAQPRDQRPIVIGSLFLKGSRAFLDLRSYERALKAIPFFDEHLGRDAARITHAAVVNRLFEAQEQLPANLDIFFSGKDMVERRPEQSGADLKATVEKGLAEGDVDRPSRVEERVRRALPEIEELPVHFYEDGIGGLEVALRMREIVALEHWMGNADFTLGDAVRMMVPGA